MLYHFTTVYIFFFFEQFDFEFRLQIMNLRAYISCRDHGRRSTRPITGRTVSFFFFSLFGYYVSDRTIVIVYYRPYIAVVRYRLQRWQGDFIIAPGGGVAGLEMRISRPAPNRVLWKSGGPTTRTKKQTKNVPIRISKTHCDFCVCI